MIIPDWLGLIWSLISQNWGIALGLVIVVLSISYHYALVKAEALPIIKALREDSKMRETLVKVKNTLLARLLLESSRTYNQLYEKWMYTTEHREEMFHQLLESAKDPEKLLKTIVDLAREGRYRREFENLLQEGKIHVEEESIESIKKLYSGIRVVDKVFEAYTHALHLKSKWYYCFIPILVFLVLALFVVWMVPKGDYAVIAISMFIAMGYYGYYNRHVPYVKEAKKTIYELEARTSIGEVLRYVTSRSE